MSELAINGGPKACDHEWPSWPVWDDAERKQLNDVLESGKWWYGDRVKEFEAKFAAFQDAKFGITCSSGTTAIEVALMSLGVGAGDEVIVPPYTFVATASAVLRINAIPVFADVCEDTFCIDPDDVENKITERTKAILPVHVAGYICDMDRLAAIAKKHNLVIVEDACHSWGSQWNGKGTGALGDCGVFSFQASKNITCAEGGIIVTDRQDIADQCRSFTNCGRGKDTPWYEHYLLASNLRITEFQAGILLAQLTRLEDQILKRQTNAAILNDGLRDLPGISVVENDPRMTRRSYHLYIFRVIEEELGISRERFFEAVNAEGVPAYGGYTPIYKNPLFLKKGDGPKFCPVSCPYYKGQVDYSKVTCPVCEKLCTQASWLRQSLLLSDEQAIRDIVAGVKKVCEHVDELK